MREFFSIIKRFAGPYKGYLTGSILLNLLSAIFNLFSFAMIIPILDIIFNPQSYENQVIAFKTWSESADVKEFLMGNLNATACYLNTEFGGSTTLLIIGCFFGFITLLKTASQFASTVAIIPMRTGIVRDIRVIIYQKLLSLPIGYFTNQKRGDIMARIGGDVNEVENSITSSLETLIKNPILIAIYFTTLFSLSWELTLFTITVVPFISFIMGAIG